MYAEKEKENPYPKEYFTTAVNGMLKL